MNAKNRANLISRLIKSPLYFYLSYAFCFFAAVVASYQLIYSGGEIVLLKRAALLISAVLFWILCAAPILANWLLKIRTRE